MSFIAEKLRSQEAELTGRVRAMQTKRYNTWKASLYGSKNMANSSIVHGTTSSFSFVRSIKRHNWYTSCDISSKLPLYSFMNAYILYISRKHDEVGVNAWKFSQVGGGTGGGGRNFTGGPQPPDPPWNRLWTHTKLNGLVLHCNCTKAILVVAALTLL